MGIFDIPFEYIVAELILPLGISFYTLQAIGYLVDVFLKKITAERDIITFSTFMSFYPQLIAGPIERGASLIPQLVTSRMISWSDINTGLNIFIFGLLSKIVFADNLSVIADTVFSDPTKHSKQELIIGVYAFAFQIYFDFSAYSLMAIGSARMFQIKLSKNFNFPYLASNIQEFWHRWHMTLSLWLRDYIYFPLGGSRGTIGQSNRNVMLTMLLCGVWHGTGLNYLIWGAYHGLLLVAHKHIKNLGITVISLRNSRITRPLFILINFHLICFGWIFFRANSTSEALLILKRIISTDQMGSVSYEFINTSLFLFTIVVAQVLYQVNKDRLNLLFEDLSLKYTVSYYIAVLALVLCFGSPDISDFIYFGFLIYEK